MFDAYEAIDDLITDININHYNEVCNELVYRVESGEITSEEAHIIADHAADVFIEKKKDKEEDDEDEKKAKKNKRNKVIRRAVIGTAAAAGAAYAGTKFVKGYKAGKEQYKDDKKAEALSNKLKHKEKLMRKLGVMSNKSYGDKHEESDDRLWKYFVDSKFNHISPDVAKDLREQGIHIHGTRDNKGKIVVPKDERERILNLLLARSSKNERRVAKSNNIARYMDDLNGKVKSAKYKTDANSSNNIMKGNIYRLGVSAAKSIARKKDK